MQVMGFQLKRILSNQPFFLLMPCGGVSVVTGAAAMAH
jgi:hypothetical protein